ncbi:hypothetical protein CYMTET_47189 [Cymbomonas tetramitiformis]|uniref:C2 domain-containing protein n=1 Tax=Cymbomonas tetramitiformis TaxID=36881 RepID=A0AAE0EW82_9CHLO|nr:hypothetical protein CYMTET_47189 [Cymbomonas tetramitiformis]
MEFIGDLTNQVTSAFTSTKLEPEAFKVGDEALRQAAAGEYQVQVQIVEGRGFAGVLFFSVMKFKRGAVSDDRLPDPIVKCRLKRADGKKIVKKTEVRKQSSSPQFASHLFFEGLQIGENELAATSLTFQVFDYKRFTRDLIIGSVDVDLESVYNLPNHEMWRTWLTLLDPTSRRKGPQGNLLVSVTVLGPGDRPVGHKEEEEEEKEENAEKQQTAINSAAELDISTLQPESVKLELYQFKLKLFNARHLPRMDRFGKGINARVKLECGSAKTVVSRTKNDFDPKFNQELLLNIRVPVQKGVNPFIRVIVMDVDTTGDNDEVASFRISLRDCVLHPEKYSEPRWMPLYGAPRELETNLMPHQSKLHIKMNAGLVPGSAYRGSVLFSCNANIALKVRIAYNPHSRGAGLLIGARGYTSRTWAHAGARGC